MSGENLEFRFLFLAFIFLALNTRPFQNTRVIHNKRPSFLDLKKYLHARGGSRYIKEWEKAKSDKTDQQKTIKSGRMGGYDFFVQALLTENCAVGKINTAEKQTSG